MRRNLNVFLRGGLGNQLFQYAAGVYLSRRQGNNLILRQDLLPATADSIEGISRWPVQITDFKMEGTLIERSHQPSGETNTFSKFMQVQRALGDITGRQLVLFGILAGEKPEKLTFSDLKGIRTINHYCTSKEPATLLGEELRAQIRQILRPTSAFKILFEQARRVRPIMVHVRLGDYASLSHLYGGPNYEAIALEVDRVRKFKSQPVWVFSDSPAEIKEEFANRLGSYMVVGPKALRRPLENLLLLASGENLICANSTFSWWAAFLKGDTSRVSFPEIQDYPVNNFSESMVLGGWVPFGNSS